MPQRELKFLLRFKSDLRALQKARGSFKKLAGAVRTVGIRAKAVAARMLAATASLKRFGAAALKASAAASAGFTRLLAVMARVGALLGTLGIGIGLGVAISTVVAFGVSMSRVQAITGELERDLSGKLNPTFAAISETVRRLGATTVFTASQAADAFGLLTVAGFKAGEAISATSAVLDLAVVGAIDLGSSANFVANAIRGFGLAASDAGRVADVFAATITRSNTDVNQLGEALKFVAPIARSMGIEIEEAAAAVGILSDAGLKGTLAGTGLRRVLIGLATQTPKATRTLKDAGVNIENLQKAIAGGGGLNEALKEFQGRQLSAAEAVDVFGLRGGPAFLVLQRLTKETGSLAEALKQAEGEAQTFAEIARDNLGGDLKILRSVIEDTILGTGGLNKAFREITQTVTGVIMVFAGTLDPLNENAKRFREIADNIRLLITGLKAVLVAFIALKIVTGLSAVLGAFGLTLTATAAGAAAATGGISILTVGLVALKAALIATGIGVLVVALGALAAAFFGVGTSLSGVTDTLNAARAPFKRAADIVERLGELSGRLALEQLPGLKVAAMDAARGLKSITDESARFSELARQLDVAGKAGEGAIAAFRVLGAEDFGAFEKFGIVLRGLLPGFTIGGEAAEAFRARLGPLAKGEKEAREELAKFNAEVARLEEAAKAFEELDKATARLEDLDIKIGDVRKTLEGFAGLAEKGLKDLDVRISDLKLPTDVDRKIADELRKAGLEVVIPVELESARVESVELVKKTEDELTKALVAATNVRRRALLEEADARASGSERAALAARAAIRESEGLVDVAKTQLKNAKDLAAQADVNIAKRKEEIKTITARVREEQALIVAAKGVQEAEKLVTKAREEGLTVDEKVKEALDELNESNDLLIASGSELALTEEELAKALAAVEQNTKKGTAEWKAYDQALRNAKTAQENFDAEIIKLNASFRLQIDNIGKTDREISELVFREELLLKAERTVAQRIGETNEAFRQRQLDAREAARATVEASVALRNAAEEEKRSNIGAAAARSLKTFVDEATNAAAITEKAFSTAFSALDTQLKQFVKTGVFDFREFALTILDEIAVLAAKAAIATALKPVLGVAGGGGGGILDIVRQGLGLAPGAKAAPAAAPAGAAAAAPTGIVPMAPDGGGFFGGGVDFAGLQAGISGIQQGIQQQQTVEALKVGFATLIDLSFQQLEQDIVLQEELIEGLGGAIRGNGGMVSQTFKDNLAKLEAGETENATQARLDALKTQQETQGGAALMANAVDVAGSKQLGVLRIMQTALLAIQLFQAIIAAFAILPFPFAKGGVTTKGMAGGQRGAGGVNPSVFLGARRFQAGGISDEDTIPALLKPEEAIIPLAGGAVPVQITPSGDQAPTREPRTIQVAITVNANDAESFVESQQEIATRMAEEIRAAEERNR